MSEVWPKIVSHSGRKMILFAVILIIASLVTGFVWAYKSVHILADGQDIKVSTIHSKPEEILTQAGVALGPKDEYRLSTAKLTSGSVIEVFRAAPVTVTVQGRTETIVTGKPTVQELAAELGIDQGRVRLEPDGSARIVPGMNIRVIMRETAEREEEHAIPYPIVRQPDPTLEKGTEELAQTGQEGVKTVKLSVALEDGREVAATVVSETEKVAPTPQVIRVGTRDYVETSRGAMRFRRVEMMEATAYHPTDGSSEGLTATGIRARNGVVAVDPDVIPLGSRVFVPGYGLALAADTGGDIVGNRIDLCMEDYSDAWRFGRRMVKVYILSE